MSALLIQLTKRADGGSVLRCVRADGSAVWQRQQGRQAAFFPLHDLTHYAVESELGFRCGFYGLLAVGWTVEETEGRGARGPLPPEALAVESIVGLLDVERAGGAAWSAAEFNQHAAAYAAASGLPVPRPLSEEELTRVRARARELLGRWTGLAPGDTLELRFEPGASCRVTPSAACRRPAAL